MNKETLKEAAEIWVNNRFTKQICGDESYPDIHASKEGIVESHILFTKCQAELFFKDDAIQTLEKGIAILLKRQEKMYSEEEFLEFSEWVSHNDWVYLPSKGYWVNEEQEELEENFTTKELFEQFKKR
jgi:hypothetical protein